MTTSSPPDPPTTRSWRRTIGAAAIATTAATAALGLSVMTSLADDADGITVYDDGLDGRFQDWSWGATDLASTELVSGGTSAIRADLAPWGGLSLGAPGTIDVPDDAVLNFDVHPGTNDGLLLRVVAMDDRFLAGDVVTIDVPAGGWTTVTIPVDQLTASPAVGGIWWQEGGGIDIAPFHVDEIEIGAPAAPTTTAPPTTAPPTTAAPDPPTGTTTG
ncbi:MAG: hypothetical protein AAGD18_26500 [Actinomycetota bacterium]